MDNMYLVAIIIIMAFSKPALRFLWTLILWLMGLRPSSVPRDPKPPEGITEVNSSVWELYAPRGMPEMVIIFFHGLQLGEFEDAFWKTWLAINPQDGVWPREWLSKCIPNARILSVTYNSCATKSDGQPDMYSLGENFVNDIINLGQDCPVFLVGHSLGGLVLKQFILSAIRIRNGNNTRLEERITKFLKNWKGVYYYATPHGGAEIANLASRLPSMSPILELLKTLSRDTRRINEEFREQRARLNKTAFSVGEGLATPFKRFKGMVVEEASAREDTDGYYTDTNSNHFTVCRAGRENDPLIRRLVEVIGQSMQNETLTLGVLEDQDVTM